MGVIVISLGTRRSATENFGCTWEHPAGLATKLGAPATGLGAPTTSLGVLATSLGAPRITAEQSGKTIFFGHTASAPGNHSYYVLFNHC